MPLFRPLIVGNWKMNGLEASLDEARALAAEMDAKPPAARVGICPPATLLRRLSDVLAGSSVLVGGQDCHAQVSGAFTGDISAEMLIDAGARLVVLGHSERRAFHGETDQMVAAKCRAALRSGLEPIICVGESLEQRRAGDAIAVVAGQVRSSLAPQLVGSAFAVAYEPLWAIGSGLTPSLAEIEEVHDAIRKDLIDLFGFDADGVPILYGGSVKPANAAEILAVPNVGGALVGGASLKAIEFAGIIRGV